jgi:hypothetical protein
MADPSGSPDWVFTDRALKVIDATHLFSDGNNPLFQGGYPRGIITTVFQAA